MARIRSIKPEFPQSETIGRLSRDARLLFVQLWTIVDDAGRARAASRMLASLLYPYDDDAAKLIDGWLDQLELERCIRRYEVSGSRYLEITNWLEHQKIDRPSPSRLPEYREGSTKPREDSRASDADLGPRTLDQERDQGPGKDQDPPSLRSGGARASRGTRLPDGWMPDQAGTDYAIELIGSPAKAHGELEKFGDYWRAQPGQRGVKADWPATWRNWCRRAAERTGGGTGPPRRTSYGNGFDDVAHELSVPHEQHGNHDPESALGFAFDDTAAAADPPT